MNRSSPVRSSSQWWPWVEKQLDARGWTKADLMRATAKYGRKVDESVIGRWQNRGSMPTRESVRAVAAVFQADMRPALIAAGLVSATELGAEWVEERTGEIDLSQASDDALIEEIRLRMAEAKWRRGTASGFPERPKRKRKSATPATPATALPAAQSIDGITASPHDETAAAHPTTDRANRTPLGSSKPGSSKPGGTHRSLGVAAAGGTHRSIPTTSDPGLDPGLGTAPEREQTAPPPSEEDEGAVAGEVCG